MLSLALYGQQRMLRGKCPQCGAWVFEIASVETTSCCGLPTNGLNVAVERMSPGGNRKRPNIIEQRTILDRQQHRCLYCDRLFGGYYVYRGRVRRVSIHWDHLVPFSFAHDNRACNFVASCGRCNTWKGNKIFQTVDDVRAYVGRKWEVVLRESEQPSTVAESTA